MQDNLFDALVVFHGIGDGWSARWLHPRFRHCFVAVRREGHWLRFDGQAGLPQLDIVGPATIDLARHYRLLGYAVLSVRVVRHGPWWPWLLGTCVGGAKRMLGIRAPWVLTPRQLHRHLNKGDIRCRRSSHRRSPQRSPYPRPCRPIRP
ncbi:MAG: hypothetical protein HOH66_13385 [Rhodospirillaceae bacterium]|jgi:hypothetical protein|nr:hypothetical protein [Rhodospirillaceae bacterium]MBT6118852.1 hypothetical protein [Rhodospirillaceae bacterium]